MADSFYVNQRLSYDGRLCTARYIGTVGKTKGQWIGVEWDDFTRGKHSGEYEGKRYFDCKIPGAGSFIRLTRRPDYMRSFLEGLKAKYTVDDDEPGKKFITLTATKVFEEVGFDKIIRKLAQLQKLKVILVDGLQIGTVDDVEEIAKTCPSIEELDLSRNLFENLDDIALICSALPKLFSLRINGNRFNSLEVSSPDAFSGITSLEISNMLLDWRELSQLLSLFPNVTTIIAQHNNFTTIPSPCPFPPSTTAMDLSYNAISAFSSVAALSELPLLHTLLLSHNSITTLSQPPTTIFATLTRLDLAFNAVSFFTELDHLPASTPALTSLRISHNPIFASVSLDDGHMLTIARLPVRVTILNHSNITPKERDNAEMWYLSRIATELSTAFPAERAGILSHHRRWEELCERHGEPVVKVDAGAAAAKTLGAKLLEVELKKGEERVVRKIPNATPVSVLRGLVCKWFKVAPVGVRLVCWSVGSEEVEKVVLDEVGDTREVGMYLDLGSWRVEVEML